MNSVKPAVSNSIDKLHKAMWNYIDRWKCDSAGPWWEADLSMDIGRTLHASFGEEAPIPIPDPPDYLGAWPAVYFRRFGTNNHFRRSRKTGSDREKEQDLPQKRLGGGLYPDWYYRKEGTDGCEWIVELKLWSLNGKRARNLEVKDALEGFESDAAKWKNEDAYPFIFMAVNVPRRFESRKHYEPADFVCELKRRLEGSRAFEDLGKEGDGVVLIKSIEKGMAQFVDWISTPKFRDSPHRRSLIPHPLL